ncbi:hypothetical protein FSP39_009569 [Pinctada imbricata]|uniref:Uncharacterized protein n=1 Tax=Pinctada imbricata TaxID=66713 RepID=A0AA89C6Z4_PINIB|nr:hypothetical protein FSP39_009569 [Pinctada imbricata]
MVEKQAPLLFTALEGIVVKNKEDCIISNTSLERIVGTALSCLLKGRAPQKATFIPTVNSVQIYKGGLEQETLKEISRTGFCLSHDATLNAINRLGTEFDNAAKTYEETSDLEIVASIQDSDSESESALSCQEEDETDLA